jgi:hypothetical protein
MTLARRTFHALNSSFRRLDSSCRHADAARRWSGRPDSNQRLSLGSRPCGRLRGFLDLPCDLAGCRMYIHVTRPDPSFPVPYSLDSE